MQDSVGIGTTGQKQPEFTEMEDYGHIGVFKNFVKYEFCDTVISAFDDWYDIVMTDTVIYYSKNLN
mgnify:CR=1 FL=1